MAEPQRDGVDGARCFLPTPPLEKTKQLASLYGCDIAIPNDAGIGNVLVYTRTVDDLSRKRGRPLSILTAALNPPSGKFPADDGLAIWANNPHVERIVDAETIDPSIMPDINRERDNLTHFGHMLENIAYHYGIRPRVLRPALYLAAEECAWAFETLQHLPRPLVCIHAHSTSGPPPGHPWYSDNWLKVIERLGQLASLFEVRLHGVEDKATGLFSPPTTLRQMFALVWASDLVVCFDSAIAHVATAFERPAVVLWDPTRKVAIEERWQRGFALAALSRWSYPQNENIVLLGDRNDEIVDIIVRSARDRLWSFDA
jgi:Glycosyltransferase family 9 (heptosyltransferase)